MAKYNYKKKKKGGKAKVIAILLAILAVGVGVAWLLTDRYYIESKERLSADKYFKLENMSPDKGIIIVDGEIADVKCHIFNDTGYLPVEYVARDLNDKFYLDKETDGVLYTNGVGTAVFTPGSNDYTNCNGEKVTRERPALIKETERFYMDPELVEEFSGVKCGSGKDPFRVAINTDKEWESATAAKDTVARYYAGIKSSIITDVAQGEQVKVLENEGDWTKVRTEDGFTGYIKTEALTDKKQEKTEEKEDDSYTHISVDTPIALSFFHVTNATANQNYDENTKDVKGLNVIVPTWYSFADNKGTINDYSSAELVEKMHKAGYKVWPAVDDFNSEVDIKELLSSKALRNRMVERLISDALYMKYDGINVDFETIKNESSNDFLQFVRELSVECRKNKLVLSIDNYPPQGYNDFYDITEQAQYADYIVIMNYDEHYAGSEEAGSVASKEFFVNNIDTALNHVPAERLINAMPFYTRVWETDAGGKVVSNEAVDMKVAAETVEKNKAKVEADPVSGQNLATYTKDKNNFSIWMEDADSIKWRLEETKKKNLAGAGFWRIGYETPDIWGLVQEYVAGK